MGTVRGTRTRLRFAAWVIALTSVCCNTPPTQAPDSEAAPAEEADAGESEDPQAEAPDSISAEAMDRMEGDLSFDAEHDRNPD